MKRLWLTLMLLASLSSSAQVQQHTIYDDSWARVPLQFPFPYYGRVFTDSYMFSNGVIGFGGVQQGWCCSGYDLTTQRGSYLNYAIMPLQTDLINYGSGRFLTEGTTSYQRYMWENISEYGAPQNLNTFGVEIRPSGSITMNYSRVNIAYHPVTIGMTGDTALNEYTQYYHGYGIDRSNFGYSVDVTGNMCLANPLSSPACPGYEAAYTAQQCSANPLYRPSCPGYEQAFFNQQCSLSALYDRTCPGYAQAYFDQQCSLNALYDRSCPGYSEAYALANLVPATSTQQVTVAVPQVQLSTSGTVSVQTPIVADPVVNEVITRPTTNANAPVQQAAPTSTTTVATQAEPKAEKKAESKQTSSPKKAEANNAVSSTGVQIVQPVHEYKSPIILDPMYRQLVAKKPIQDNNRSMYHLIMSSQKKHEEMIDEQWRKVRERD